MKLHGGRKRRQEPRRTGGRRAGRGAGTLCGVAADPCTQRQRCQATPVRACAPRRWPERSSWPATPGPHRCRRSWEGGRQGRGARSQGPAGCDEHARACSAGASRDGPAPVHLAGRRGVPPGVHLRPHRILRSPEASQKATPNLMDGPEPKRASATSSTVLMKCACLHAAGGSREGGAGSGRVEAGDGAIDRRARSAAARGRALLTLCTF